MVVGDFPLDGKIAVVTGGGSGTELPEYMGNNTLIYY